MNQIEDEIDNKKKTFEFLKINKDDGATELEEYERFRRIFIITFIWNSTGIDIKR